MNLPDRFNLRERVIVLTGATGRYGRGLAADLAATGAHLIITSRDADRSRAIADAETQLGHRVAAESFDQGSEPSIQALCDRILKRHGRIDGLVNNAVAHPMATPESPVADWNASLQINATGLMLMHRIFRAPLHDSRVGSIVNVGSIFGTNGPLLSRYENTHHPVPTPDYFFHKGGLLNLTRYYAALFGPDGIRVNCVSPGGFQQSQSEEYVRSYAAHTCLRRMANDTDLGGAVAFLLSDAAAYITGANLPVDGGYSAV